LYLALKALDIGPGDEVICPDLTWPSPAHAILQSGAEPVLVDVDWAEWNSAPAAFSAARTARTRAAIVIDQFGNPARTPEIAGVLPGVTLVVDAACSLGSTLGGAPCGSSGTVACTSFHPRKVVTTGEGGMCLTDDGELAGRLRALRNHGQQSTGVFIRASGNFRMSELAAGLGLAQMERLDAVLSARRELGRRYRELLSGQPGLAFQEPPPGASPNYQTFGVVLPEGCPAETRDRIIELLGEQGVEAARLSHALHQLRSLERATREARRAGHSFEVAQNLAQRGLALPLFPGLSRPEQDKVVDALAAGLKSAGLA
jgi:perosamine synthetase